MNLREQLEEASGGIEPVRHREAKGVALAVVGVLVLAAAVTFGLGREDSSRSALPWLGAYIANALLLGGLALALRLGRPPVFASRPSFALLLGMVAMLMTFPRFQEQ